MNLTPVVNSHDIAAIIIDLNIYFHQHYVWKTSCRAISQLEDSQLRTQQRTSACSLRCPQNVVLQPSRVVTVQRNEEGPVVKKDPQELPKNTNETPQDPPKETQEKPKPLFADLFQNKQGMGIFTAAKKGLLDSAREEPKIDYKAPNLFNNNGFKTETNK